MSNRHLARTTSMQALYEWDFNGKPAGALDEILARNKKEFMSNEEDEGFTDSLIQGVVKHQKEIDEVIVKYAPEWPIEQITIVDRNILRVGVFELLFAKEIPSKVAINEAIEIAKTFGGESSGKFVNGVLGAIYRDRAAQGTLKPIDLEESKKEKAQKEKKDVILET